MVAIVTPPVKVPPPTGTKEPAPDSVPLIVTSPAKVALEFEPSVKTGVPSLVAVALEDFDINKSLSPPNTIWVSLPLPAPLKNKVASSSLEIAEIILSPLPVRATSPAKVAFEPDSVITKAFALAVLLNK